MFGIVSRKQNRIVVVVDHQDFNLTVTGFDVRRDLYVDVRHWDELDGTTA